MALSGTGPRPPRFSSLNASQGPAGPFRFRDLGFREGLGFRDLGRV